MDERAVGEQELARRGVVRSTYDFMSEAIATTAMTQMARTSSNSTLLERCMLESDKAGTDSVCRGRQRETFLMATATEPC